MNGLILRLRLQIFILLLALAAGSLAPAHAEIKREGRFAASAACPAYLSFRKSSNPGNVRLEPGQVYDVLAQNIDDPSHYRITVPGASPEKRWVEIGCGTLQAATANNPQPTDQSTKDQPFYVLALSWQPAFCEGARSKPECESQSTDGFYASHFTLHGLWPQPRRNQYCRVSETEQQLSENGKWLQLPQLALTPETAKALAQAMPGTQSGLERHEWTKHGSCYPGDAESYFAQSLRLLEAVNDSPVQAFVAANRGKQVRTSDLRAAFDAAFGPGAGERVRVACRDDGSRRLIVELTIGLRGDVAAGTDIKTLMAAAPMTDPGCPGGIIDPVGFQ